MSFFCMHCILVLYLRVLRTHAHATSPDYCVSAFHGCVRAKKCRTERMRARHAYTSYTLGVDQNLFHFIVPRRYRLVRISSRMHATCCA